jgi:chemotaxis methyl-accepting protein methylase
MSTERPDADAELCGVAALLERESGIQIKQPRFASLAAALHRISPEMSPGSFIGAARDAARAPSLLGALIDEVAVQETYFMRERNELEAIDWGKLLTAAHARGDHEVRVWVCACASGEEAYSLAMLAIESLGLQSTPVSILASDISERALARARAGIYNERSTREVEEWRRERFFVDHGRKSAVGRELRGLVRLARHNLMSDGAPPLGETLFDLILCRNVLIYFDAANVDRVVRKLESALQPGGQLILGASDRLSSIARRLGDAHARAGRAAAATSSAASRRRRTPATPPLGKGTGSAARRPVRDARNAANLGDYHEAIGITAEILASDPLDAEAYLVRGLSELAAGDPSSAVESLRRALYIEPTLAVAAFQLGRACDLSGDPRAAVRAYRQALGVLDASTEGHLHLPEQVQASDLAAACRSRLGAQADGEAH